MHKLFTKVAAPGEKVSFTAEFSDLTLRQAEEFKRMFAWMNFLGGIGASREFAVWYDGDGSARATIEVDGERLKPGEEDQEKEDHNGHFEKLHFGLD